MFNNAQIVCILLTARIEELPRVTDAGLSGDVHLTLSAKIIELVADPDGASLCRVCFVFPIIKVTF
jgi:hypothetical protein